MSLVQIEHWLEIVTMLSLPKKLSKLMLIIIVEGEQLLQLEKFQVILIVMKEIGPLLIYEKHLQS